jgi:hypothetical protein
VPNQSGDLRASLRRAADAAASADRASDVLADVQRVTKSIRGPVLAADQFMAIRKDADGVLASFRAAQAIAPAGIVSIDRSIREAVSGWQGQLLVAPNLSRAMDAVSKSVAEAFASRQTHMSDTIRALAATGVVVKPEIFSTGKVLQEISAALDSPFKELARQTRVAHLALADALRPAALAAAAEWAEAARLRNGRQRAAVAALQRDGWWVAPSWPLTLPARLVALREAEGKRALDREVRAMYRADNCRALRAMVRSWDDEPAFRVRRPIIREAVELHREGRYKSSIPTLLPHVEGIAVDVFSPGAGAKNPMLLYKDGVDPEQLDRMLGEALLFTLDVLYQWVPFASINPRARTWNRHVVLHGRSINYASEANSLRVFLTLDQLASEIRAKRRHDAKLAVSSA